MRNIKSRAKAKTFVRWMATNFTEQRLRDIANHGASGGFTGLTSTAALSALHKMYLEELWGRMSVMAEEVGEELLPMINVMADRYGISVESLEDLATVIVWACAESIARELIEEE